MKKGTIVVVLLLALLAFSDLTLSRVNVGVGVKFAAARLPFMIANLKIGMFGLEGGTGLRTFAAGEFGDIPVSLMWFLANGRVYFPITRSPLHPYAAAGLIGLRSSLTSPYFGEVAAIVVGAHALGGLEVSAVQYGIPLVVFSGVDYIWMPGGPLELWESELGFSFSGFSWHIGARLEF